MHMEMSPTGVLELPNASMKPSLDNIYIRTGFECGDNNASPGNCPWCSAKGQTNSLRYYAINLEETIMLCTNPVCFYPLVSRPLEDVRASLSKDLVGCKRKASSLSVMDDISCPSKRPREENLEELSAVPESHDADLNGCTLVNHTTKTEMFTEGLEVLEKNTVSVNGTEERNPEEVPVGTDVDLDSNDKKDDGVSSTQEVVEMDVAMETSTELVPLQPHLFWRNEDSLCWMDSLMVMLVNCRTIREAQSSQTSVTHSNSVVWNLCSTYDETCAYVKSKEQQCEGKEKLTRVPADVLDEAERRLSALRLSLFKVLQPTLKCEIGQKETPVFALPLLLQTDKWAQDLFQHTVRWEFKCTACGHSINESVEKTLTTLTQILNDWHPLKATNRIQCSNCNRKNQRRKMMLERLSSVFALHFVEGLPRKDLSKYSFEFQGSQYNVSTVIQYNKHLEHFVTWIRQSNGLWLELDDLKYPYSVTHKRLIFPANEIHIVFWEAESRKDDASEIGPVTAPSTVKNTDDKQPKLSDSAADDTSVLNAVTVKEDADLTAASTLDASIGSTTLLDTFEGLSHQDIVTLTLVEENAAPQVTDVQIPQSPATMLAVLPNLPVASSLSSRSTSDGSPPSSKNDQRCSSGSKKQSTLVASEVTLPSVVRSSVATEKPATLPATPAGRNLGGIQHLSLLQRHPCFQSTPVNAPVSAPKPKPILRCENSEAQPAKPADMFCGFLTKKSPTLPNPGVVKNPSIAPQQKSISLQGATCPTGKASEILKSAGKKTPSLSADNQPISTTEALRLKLMKKLKAKKKKLAKLNQLLANAGESAPRPDSTAVTSSTSAYDSPAYDQFFAELLSPATTVSNLSPDSTGLLEILNNQNGETTNGSSQDSSVNAAVVPEQTQSYPSCTDSVINDFDNYVHSGMGQTAIENTDFNELEDLFF